MLISKSKYFINSKISYFILILNYKNFLSKIFSNPKIILYFIIETFINNFILIYKLNKNFLIYFYYLKTIFILLIIYYIYFINLVNFISFYVKNKEKQNITINPKTKKNMY